MACLNIALLGTFQATLDGEPITTFESDKVRALLAYLLVEADRPHRRESLIGLLWPDWPERSARGNLSQALYNLRSAIGDREADPPFLTITQQAIQFNRDSDHWLDVATFDRLLTDCGAHDHPHPAACDPCLARLEKAVALYQGEFLAGFSLPDSAPFEEWALVTREHLHRWVLEALHSLANCHEAHGDMERAVGQARRAVELDPCWETGQRGMIRLLALSGQTSAALAQYETLRRVLEQELRVAPSEETRELYQLLLKGGRPAAIPPAAAISERKPRPVGACPYRGLVAFREADAPFFFGREEFVGRLAETMQTQSMVAVIVGPSGSGKSSVIFAGLLPRLRDEKGWLIAHFRPSSQPFQAAAAALLPLLLTGPGEVDRLVESSKLADALNEGSVSLFQVVTRALEKQPDAERLLLVVDQFEELYTLYLDREGQRRFLDKLLAAVAAADEQRHSPLVLLLTLRADFMGQALAHRPFADALQEASLIMGPMTREELRAAIERPAEKQGAAFEEGLVERIMDDVGEDPGNLPLLEFALTLLWEAHSYGWLTHAAYESIGRVSGALARYADQVCHGLAENERQGARRVFVQLVRPGEGTEDTRRVATRAELGERNWELVQHLADRRLVVTGRDPGSGVETVEVVHEALIQGWGQLREWLGADRAFRTWQERLRAALRAWEACDQDAGALLRGAPLAEAEGWQAEREDELSAAEIGFIQASSAEREALQAEKEARQQRELETAHQLAQAEKQRAEEQSRAARQLRHRAAGLLVALVVATTLAIAALLFWQQSSRNATLANNSAATAEAEQRRAEEASDARATQQAVAEEQARLAFSRELAAAALNSLDEDQERAVLLAIQALNQARTQEAEEAFHRAVQGFRLLRTLQAPGKSPFVAASPDGRLLVASGETGATMWDVTTGEVLYNWDVGHYINRAAFNLDGKLLLLPNEGTSTDNLQGGQAPGTVTIVDAATGTELLTFQAHDQDWVQTVAISPDGTLFATGGGDGRIRVWDLAATLAAGVGQEQLSILVAGTPPWKVEFSPDGTRLAADYDDNTVRLWDIQTGRQVWQVNSALGGVAFSADGSRLVISGDPGMLDVLDSRSGQRLSRTLAHAANVQSVQFSPDGAHLASASNDGTVKVWTLDEDALSLKFTLAGHQDTTYSVAFSPDGERLISGSNDGTVRVWDISPDGSIEPVLYPHQAVVQSLAFSPDGSQIATAGFDGVVIISEPASGQVLWVLPASDRLWQVAYSPDGALLAAAASDATITVWEAKTGRQLAHWAGHTRANETAYLAGAQAAAFSPDGRQLATAAQDGSIRVWDAAALRAGDPAIGDELFTLEEPTGKFVYTVVYSPDGRWIAAGVNYSDGPYVYREAVIKVWQAATGELQWTFGRQPSVAYLGVAFSADSQRLATGSLSGLLIGGEASVWLLPADPAGAPQELFTVRATKDFVSRLNFSPDGTELAVPGSNVMAIYDAGSGELVRTLFHPAAVMEAVYSPDGERLATAGFDGFGRLFFLDLDELLALAQSRLTRALTPEECQKYLHQDRCP